MTTRLVLLATLGVTVVATLDVARRDALQPGPAAWYLLLFTALFVIRVVGQIVVGKRAPRWLPAMNEWNLMPYRLLLPIQIVFIALMSAITLGVAREQEPVGVRHESFGAFLIGLSAVYAASMVVRYAVRMWRRPEQRWFGGAIPIVFHVVLAAFLFTWGTYLRG